MGKKTRPVLYLAAGLAALLLLIQLIPLNRDNPPVVTQAAWDSPQTQEIFRRACADCHSNETVWPWYAQVAPAAWLVARDVREGREHFNISDLPGMDPKYLRDLPEEVQEVVEDGEMPMGIYVMMHPEAKLTQEERQALIRGLRQTLENTR